MMSLSRWNPFEDLTNLHFELDQVFGQTQNIFTTNNNWSWEPATEVTSTERAWKLRMELPGIDSKEVHIELKDNVLKINGERNVSEDKAEQHLSEFGYGRFERNFRLPDHIDSEKVTADFENGILAVTLPVAESAQPRRIEISYGSKGTKRLPRN